MPRNEMLKLNRAGFLQGAYLVLTSLTNVKKLIDMRHRRRIGAGAASPAASS